MLERGPQALNVASDYDHFPEYLCAATEVRRLMGGKTIKLFNSKRSKKRTDVTDEVRLLLDIVCVDLRIDRRERHSFFEENRDLAEKVGRNVEKRGGVELMKQVAKFIPMIDRERLSWVWSCLPGTSWELDDEQQS